MRKSTQQKVPQKLPPQPPKGNPTVKGKTVAQPAPVQEVKPFNINDYVKDGLSKDEVLDFKTAFDIFDHGGNGKVQMAEIKQAFTNLGFHHQSKFAQNILHHLQRKHGQLLDFGEFIRIATAKINQNYTQPQTNLVFTAFDPKGTGKFSVYDLKDTVRDIGEDIGDDEIEKMFKAADQDGDGYVTSQDFYNIITKNIRS